MKVVLPAAGAGTEEATRAEVTRASSRPGRARPVRVPEGAGATASVSEPTPTEASDVEHPVWSNWIDDVLADSFPASDPPSWTLGMVSVRS